MISFGIDQIGSFYHSTQKSKQVFVNKFMKLLEIVLLEHYVNLLTVDEKRKYVDEVWDMLQKAYAPIGGFKSAASKEELIDDSSMWKLVRRNGKIVAVFIYKDKFGRKSIACATDGSDQGKADLIKTKSDDTKMRRAWAEVSGKVESIMIKAKAVPVSNKYAAKLTGKEILGYDVDGVHYTRLIAGEPHVKAIYGFPKIDPEVEQELEKHQVKLTKTST
jgi:hypothetical protein